MINKKCISKMPTDMPRLALLIGISYLNTKLEISDAYSDLHYFILYLKNIGFTDNDIIILTDSTAFDNRVMPDNVNIIYYINKLVEFANNNTNSYIVFYYTGHGLRYTENNNIHDAIVPVNYTEAIINGNILKEILVDKLNSNVTFFSLIDCCYSGNILKLKYSYVNDKQYIYNNDDQSICTAYVISLARNNNVTLKILSELGKYNKEKKSLLTMAFCETYKMNAFIGSLIMNMQININNRINNNNLIQFTSNKPINIQLAMPFS